MEAMDPADHKAILNSLHREVQEQWAENAPDIILPAIRAKFSQNKRLLNFLVETYPLAIGEASRDSMWGWDYSSNTRRFWTPINGNDTETS